MTMLLEATTPNCNAFSIENLSRSSTEEKTVGVRNQQTFNTIKPLPPLLPFHMTPHYGNANTDFNRNITGAINETDLHSMGMTPSKRKRDNSVNDDVELEAKRAQDNASTVSRCSLSPTSSSHGESDHEQAPARTLKKKSRTTFSSEQIQGLETAYDEHKYLSAADRTLLARKLLLTDQQVKTWFQNRRMKEKRQEKEDEQPKGIQIPTGGIDISQLAALGIPCPPPPIVAQINGGPMPAILSTRLQMPNSPQSLLDKSKYDSTSERNSPISKVPSMYPQYFPGYPFVNGYSFPASPLLHAYPMHALMSPLRMGQHQYVYPGPQK